MKTNYDFTENGSFEVVDGDLILTDSNGNWIYSKASCGYEAWCSENNTKVHFKTSDGFEIWREYDENDALLYRKTSNGSEEWYDCDGHVITKEQFDK